MPTPRSHHGISRQILIPLLMLALPARLSAGAEPPGAIAPLTADQAQAHQLAWAKHLKQDATVTNALGMKLSLIPPGQFDMGSPAEEQGRQPHEVQHHITMTRPYYMATTEVTQKQWQALMGKNPSFFAGDDLPVETVTWNDAAAFCKKLSQKEHKHYRLPTEAEWEYACRAGTTTPFNTGDTIHPDQANYNGNNIYGPGKKGAFREQTTEAGHFPPNAWGLCDMHGNVWEWCADWYGEYPNGEAQNPTGPAQGDRRVMRGGCWITAPAVCRSANRGGVPPVSWNFHTGFRVVMDAD